MKVCLCGQINSMKLQIRLLWDLIKYRIRQVSIKYSKEKARKKRKKDIWHWDLSQDLRRKVQRITNLWESGGAWNVENGIWFCLRTHNKRRHHPIKGTWYEKGEKSNKYFFFLNLETHKKAKSSVRKVFSMKECKSQILKTFCRRFKIFIPISVKAILSDQLLFA